jgi:hypothetical protein
LLNQFAPAYDVRKRSNGVAVRVLLRVARRAERRRRARGGCFRVAAANAEWAQGWMAWAPFLDPVVLRIAGTRALDRRPDARERLGLAASGRIALFFGSKDSKHPQAVFDAFSTLEGWTLVVAGELVASVDPRANPDVVRSSNRVSNESRDPSFARRVRHPPTSSRATGSARCSCPTIRLRSPTRCAARPRPSIRRTSRVPAPTGRTSP